MHYYKKLKINVDMGDEIFGNMRDGNWLIDYSRNRLQSDHNIMGTELEAVFDFYGEFFEDVKKLPVSFRPKYGSAIIEKVYNAALKYLIQYKMDSEFV